MKNINIEQYNATEIHLHKAVQLVAFLGKKLGEHQPDDSHTTIVYDPQKNALIGKPITINGTTYLAEFRLKNYYLALYTENSSYVFGLKGRTIPTILKEVKRLMNIDDLPDFKLHYDLPEDYQLDQYQLEQPSYAAINEWTSVRQMAAKTFEIVNTLISPSSPINIWPHHFDTGTYHVLKTEQNQGIASIGCGFAVADTVSPEPYFYIYGWAKNKEINFDKAPKLTFGAWKTGNWKGAILPLSTVLSMSNQKEDLTTFFETTISFFKAYL